MEKNPELERLWLQTECTCTNGNGSLNHKLDCAKWEAILAKK